jgi:hypothetical protein
MTINSETSITELAVLVSTTLADAGIDATLVGGGAAAMHSNQRYLTRDLDYIAHATKENLDMALMPLGFEQKSDRYYRHANTELVIEFPSGPLAIGDHYIYNVGTKELLNVTIQILTPTQCVMDRLMWFFHSSDRQALATAIMIAKSNEIDLGVVRDWAEGEGETEKFEIFLGKL